MQDLGINVYDLLKLLNVVEAPDSNRNDIHELMKIFVVSLVNLPILISFFSRVICPSSIFVCT